VQFIINNKLHYLLSGTDGFRLLCHQFYTSSLPQQANCIKRFSTFLLRMKQLREALLLLWWSTGVQGHNTRPTVYPLQSGRPCCIVFWSRGNRCERWQQHTVSLMKRSVASFVLLRKSMYSKKRNYTIYHDGYAHRVFLLCSRTNTLHSQHYGYQRQRIFAFMKGHPNCCPPLQARREGWQEPWRYIVETRNPASLPYPEHSRWRRVTPGHKTDARGEQAERPAWSGQSCPSCRLRDPGKKAGKDGSHRRNSRV